MKQLTLKNYFLYQDPTTSLQGFLSSLALHGKETRARSKFMKIIMEKAAEIDRDRREILMNHCKKQKVDGKELPVLFYVENEVKKGKDGIMKPDKKVVETTDTAKGTNYMFSKPEDENAFNKEWAEYLKEEFVIDVLPSVSECIYTVRDLILNTTKEFSGPQAEFYNEWCEAFENINEPATKLSKP